LETLEQELLPVELTSYSITLGENLYQRLAKHIHLLKHLDNHSLSKQRWVTDSLIEKLEKDETLESDLLIKKRYLHFKVSSHLNEKIEKKIEVIRKFQPFFTKKQWFVEAIFEKLDREEQKVKTLLDKTKN
jgi:hypothetical protein